MVVARWAEIVVALSVIEDQLMIASDRSTSRTKRLCLANAYIERAGRSSSYVKEAIAVMEDSPAGLLTIKSTALATADLSLDSRTAMRKARCN